MICYLAINCLGPVHTRTATPNQALAQPLMAYERVGPRSLLPSEAPAARMVSG
jgi:hypothetical protein